MQLDALIKHFQENPYWDYATKLRIAESLGMTYAQVSKWSWDTRKKLGLKTQHAFRCNIKGKAQRKD